MALIESGPITISTGGVYTGLKIVTTSANQNAITVNCYDPVEIKGMEISGPGKAIHASGGTKLNIHHNTFTGSNPESNLQVGRVADVYHPQSFVFEHNTVDRSGGIRIDHKDENTKTVYIRYNKFLNTDKRLGNGSEGDHRASILIDGVVGMEGEISWNYFENKPNLSWVEDNINLRNSGGTQAKPFLIHDNYIRGAYPSPLSYNPGNFTGSGITVEGDPATNTHETVSQYIKIYNNQVISVMNGGINVNAGHDIEVHHNKILASGQIDGVFYPSFWSGGAIWNGSNVPYPAVFHDIDFHDNTVGYYRQGVNVGGINRQDWTFVSGSPISVDPARNISLPNPITAAMEDAELPIWNTKVANSGYAIGNTTDVPTSPNTGTTIKVGATIKGIVTPLNPLSKASTYRLGSLIITGDSVVSITGDSKDEKIFYVKGLKAGTATITATLLTNGGNTLTKTTTVKVEETAEEAVDIKFEFFQI